MDDDSRNLADEMRRNKDGTVARIGFLIGADHCFDKLPPDDGVEARGRLIQNQKLRLWADRGDERHLRPLAFGKRAGPL